MYQVVWLSPMISLLNSFEILQSAYSVAHGYSRGQFGSSADSKEDLCSHIRRLGEFYCLALLYLSYVCSLLLHVLLEMSSDSPICLVYTWFSMVLMIVLYLSIIGFDISTIVMVIIVRGLHDLHDCLSHPTVFPSFLCHSLSKI